MGRKLYLFFTFIFFTQFANGQLSNFTLNVTHTNETCSNNGTLAISVSNTTPGATMLFSIFLLPDVTTPISVQSALSISGLDSGTYRVVATQSLGNQNGSQQQDVIIEDSVVVLSYQCVGTNEICGNDGIITVSVNNGAAQSYEIISGPMTRPLQASNTFTGLIAGVYQMRVVDICNQRSVQTFTLQRSDPRLSFALYNPSLASCTQVGIGASFQSIVPSPGGAIKYPIQVITTLTPPSGAPLTYNQTVTSGASGFTEQVPLYSNQTYSYSFAITDGCGITYNLSGLIQNLSVGVPTFALRPDGCTRKAAAFAQVLALTLVSAPAGYTGTVPQNFTPQITPNHTVNVGSLTAGTYVFNATDLCGNVHVITVEVQIDNNNSPPSHSVVNVTCIDATIFIYEITSLILVSCPPSLAVTLPQNYTNRINSANYAVFTNMPVGNYVFNVIDKCGNPSTMLIAIVPPTQGPSALVLEGCDVGVGSLQITGQLTAISLINAPAAYGAVLPQVLTGNVTSNGTKLTMDSLPPGTYVFQSVNSCGQTSTTTVNIVGYTDDTIATVTANCGSFNFNLSHSSNNNGVAFWLQKYDAVNNVWMHPLTNTVYPDGSNPNAANSVLLANNSTTFNLVFVGHFRVLKVYRGYANGNLQPINCFKTIHEFDFAGNPKINDIYSVSCGTTFEIVVNAQGNSPLTYRIVRRNGQPFTVNNGNSGIFTGLQPALYVFEVEDECHNAVTREFEVLNPNPMQISATPITCDGESLTLSLPNFYFLSYQWWKGNDTGTILGTSNSLNFSSFNSATDNGTYHVRVSFTGNPNSCLNQVLHHTVLLTPNIPHAGNDNAVSHCGRIGTVDLNTLLNGNFDPTGTWTETTSSNALTNNLWDSSNVPFGTYRFVYTVNGSCNLVDDASVNITIKEVPATPTATVDPIICESKDIHLFATAVPNAAYHWTGPDNFTSMVQNPVINSISAVNNGIYSVFVEANGCRSGVADIGVQANPLPVFTLGQDCVGREYQIWVTQTNSAGTTFSWTGPNNFSGNQSPMTITGGSSGIYFLTVTDENGCEATDSIDVGRTICFIPNVITPNNDESNQSLDLSGFDVDKLEIYSRWGKKVYERKNYTNEWHGQNMSGGQLPDSTYYYIIELGAEGTKTGWIYLSRG